ncbi:MAG: cation transporter [Acidimicrobiia bacterium]|nr:cation transporter [Acidimicrobiia bacterium]
MPRRRPTASSGTPDPVHEGSKKAIFAAFFANLSIAIAKLAAALITGSASLLAESVHSFADTGNQGLLLLGGRRAQRAPDARHPFGYGAERFFWAFVVALVLFSLGALFSLYEGIGKLLRPHDVDSVGVAFAVLGLAILLEGWSLRTAVREAGPHRHGRSWLAFIRQTKNPELPVVLLEDTGALAGLMIALIGLTLAVVTGEPRYDAIGSIGIGLLLLVIAIVLAVEMKSLLIGESAAASAEAGIRDTIAGSPEVRSVIHLRTLQLGPEDVLVAAKVDFVTDDVPTLARAIDAVEVRIRAHTPEARLIFLEPDLDRSRAITAPD